MKLMRIFKIHLFIMTLVIALIGCEKDDASPTSTDNPNNTDNPVIPEFPDKDLLLGLVNSYRTAGCNCGTDFFPAVDPLAWNDTLELAAEMHCIDMNDNNFFSHTGSDGSTAADRVSRVNYPWRAVGENIARRQVSEQKVVEAWINSVGHCRNIMNGTFEEMGLAEYNLYWTQVFAKK